MNNRKFVENTFNQIASLKARDVKLGHGSFITMGFGKDISTEVTIRGKKEIKKRPEWYLWVYMCSWEIKMHDEFIVCSDDEKEYIKEGLNHIENKKLLKAEMLNDTYDMELEFEDGIKLCLFSNLEEDLEQWMLFTPDNNVLTAGPFQNLTYENEF